MKKTLLVLVDIDGTAGPGPRQTGRRGHGPAGGTGLPGRANRGAARAPTALTLAYRADAACPTGPAAAPAVYCYVFNTAPAPGFVLVAGYDQVTPVLGYSNQSAFDAATQLNALITAGNLPSRCKVLK